MHTSDAEYVSIDKFEFIQWEDEAPWNIQELIEEYEIESGMKYDFGKIKVVNIDTSKLAAHNGCIYIEESEETEVKKDLINKVNDIFNGIKPHEHFDGTQGVKNIEDAEYNVNYIVSGLRFRELIRLINQLDEPEVLSQDWMDKHKAGLAWSNTDTDTSEVTYYIKEEDLQNLLVPKQIEIKEEQVQEELIQKSTFQHDGDWYQVANLDRQVVLEKPTIPKFIAELIEVVKEDVSKGGTLQISRSDSRLEDPDKINEWLMENYELYCLAYSAGYEVEQKYVVVIPHQLNNAFDLYLCETEAAVYFLDKEDEFNERVKYKFTKEEIKEINPDYMTFAVPVEELEE